MSVVQPERSPVNSTSVIGDEKQKAAITSVWAAVLLTSMKLIVGLLTSSLGILAEAVHSGLDLVAAFVTFLAVRLSDKPADEEHTYGHGKIENLSALIETLLLFVTCFWIIEEAIERLFFKLVEIDPSIWAFVVMCISIAVDINRSKMLRKAATKYGSQALEADAIHFSTDVWSSSVVIGGLCLVWLGKSVFREQTLLFSQADAVAALGVALIVISVSYKLGKRTVDILLDRAPEGLPQRIAQAARKVQGVLGTSQVRVRRSGPSTFIDLNVAVDRNLPFERAHSIAEVVESQVQDVAPGADVMVHTDPQAYVDESVVERIRMIAARNQLAVHNIAAHETKGRNYVDLHLEVDEHLTLQQAHDRANRLEKEIRADMSDVSQVNTHIEARATGVSSGKDVTDQMSALVQQIREISEEVVGQSSCQDVKIRSLGDKLAVLLDCTFDRDLSIANVHEITALIEDRLRHRIRNLDHVLVHTEPRIGEDA
jgi:cation diffusion facilitator family transporter